MPPGSVAIIQQHGPPQTLQASPPQQLHLASVDQPPPMGAQGTVQWGAMPSMTFSTVPSPTPVPIQPQGPQHIQQPNVNVVFSSPHANHVGYFLSHIHLFRTVYYVVFVMLTHVISTLFLM